jgi:acid phosphatase
MSFVPVSAQNNSSGARVVFPPEKVPNLGQIKQLLRSYHDCTCKCGCYTSELNEQADRAIAFLEKRKAAQKSGEEKLSVVLDVDETSLSNYSFYESTDMGRIPRLFEEWARSAQAPRIESTLRLFQKARQLQLEVFFISGRQESLRAATEQNLKREGYGDWAGLLLRPKEDKSKTVAEFKSSARRKIADQGYDIILNVGDQLSDLNGEPAAELSVKLPNPFYLIQ